MSALEGSVSQKVKHSNEGHRLNQQLKTVNKPKAAKPEHQRITGQRQTGSGNGLRRTADSPRLSDKRLLQYEREGFLVTPQLLAADAVLGVREAVQQNVKSNKLAALKQR